MKTTFPFNNLLPILFGSQLLFLAPAAFSATRVWTNVVGNANWSNAANWSNGVPVNGDSVVLLRHPFGQAINAVNDLTNITLASVRCEATGYNLAGGTLRLSGEVVTGGPVAGAFLNISAPIEIIGPTLRIDGANDGNLTVAGVVNAPPGAVVTVDSPFSFRAPANSDYRAETRLRRGTIALLSTRIKGPFIVGGGGSTNFATVALQSGNLFGEFPPLTILTNGAVINISTFQAVGPLVVDGGTLRVGNRAPQGDITVHGDARFTGGAAMLVSSINLFGPGGLSVTGNVALAGCTLAFQAGSEGFVQPHVILRNDGTDAVNGTFTALPEGGSLTNKGVRYLVSYVGGDGNDITLTPVVEPARFLSSALTNGAPTFLVQGQSGFRYVTEATTNLSLPAGAIFWLPIRTNTAFDTGQFLVSDPDATNFPRRFYRVVKP